MGKYFITGRQGTGKTSVIRTLQARGFTAYNTDEMETVTRLQDSKSGAFIPWPEGQIDWDTVRWNWQADALKTLLATDETVFVGAVTSNQADFYSLFDATFALIVPPEILITYLAQHEHNYTQTDIDRMIFNQPKQQKFLDAGAIPIANDGSIDDVVDKILEYIHAH